MAEDPLVGNRDREVVLMRPLSPKACAALAGVSYHTILRAIRAGHLRASQPPGTTIYRIAPADLHEWLYGHPVAPSAGPDVATTPLPRATTPRATPSRAGSVDALTAIEEEAAA